ncbi:MAG: ABC transporter permease [Burkholderiales bacterium]|nr:MAG: ABC transporter permease [Burkholderiales bacterium]
MNLQRFEWLLVPLVAVLAGLLLFSAFIVLIGHNPLATLAVIFEGAFGSAFSWQNTLMRAAPLLLTGLAVALAAQAGLVIIGGEGALALGGLAAAAAVMWLGGLPPSLVVIAALLAGALTASVWIGLVGVLRAYRGLNETIASLLLSYIAIALFNHFVEGSLRDPSSLNKPSTFPVGEAHTLGAVPGINVHWGLPIGIVLAVLAQIWVSRSVLGFSLKVAGGNSKAAKLVGLPVNALVVLACVLSGLAAGLAGAIEVLAVHGAANASILAGYGYTGILVSFMARHQPLAIIPVAVLMGGIAAAGSLLQRRLDLPDATTLVLQGCLFISILACEALYGRLGQVRFKSASKVAGQAT